MNAYSIFLGIGASFGLIFVALRLRSEARQAVLDAGLGVLLGALVGGRILYVITAWSYYQAHLVEAVQFWAGGYAWEGAVLGGLVALLAAAGIKRSPVSVMADALLPLFPPLLVSIWLGCWQIGVAYGRPAGGAWWGVPARDEWGTLAPRFPLQPLGAFLTILVFLFIDLLHPRLRRPGQAACLAFVGVAAGLLGLSFLRADPSLIWKGFRMDSWASAALVLAGSAICLAAFRGQLFPDQRKDKAEAPNPQPLP